MTEKLAVDFNLEAEQWFKDRFAQDKHPPEGEEKEKLIRKRREMLFYRVSEIYARADLINQDFCPDLTVCIHLNAAPWKDANQSELVERNDYHVLVNGCYMGGELAYDNQRFEMLIRLLNGWNERERDYAESLSVSLARGTGLPAFAYKGPNALKIGSVPGVWARNLLANRLYRSPVVFLEPYIANSKQAYRRIAWVITRDSVRWVEKCACRWSRSMPKPFAKAFLWMGPKGVISLTFPRNPSPFS